MVTRSKKNAFHLAAQRIRKSQIKWGQGAYRRVLHKPDGGKIIECCMMGAIRSCIGMYTEDWYKNNESDNNAKIREKAYVIGDFAEKYIRKQVGTQIVTVTSWNDGETRKRHEVLQMLDDMGDAWEAAQDGEVTERKNDLGVV